MNPIKATAGPLALLALAAGLVWAGTGAAAEQAIPKTEIGAHEEGYQPNIQVERWILAVRAASAVGEVRFQVAFIKAGTAMVPLNHYIGSLEIPDRGLRIVHSGINPVMLAALEKEFNKRLAADPENEELQAVMEELSGPGSERWTPISVEARPIRFPLRLEYGKARMARPADERLEYELSVSLGPAVVRGGFEVIPPIIGGHGAALGLPRGGRLNGFVAPLVRFTGTLEYEGEALDLRGRAVYARYWYSPWSRDRRFVATQSGFLLDDASTGTLDILYRPDGEPEQVVLALTGPGRQEAFRDELSPDRLTILSRIHGRDRGYPGEVMLRFDGYGFLLFRPLAHEQFVSAFADIGRYWSGFYRVYLFEAESRPGAWFRNFLRSSTMARGWAWVSHRGFEPED